MKETCSYAVGLLLLLITLLAFIDL